MKKLVLRLFIAFVVLPAALTASVFYLNHNGFFNIQIVEVRADEATIGQELYLKPLLEKVKEDFSSLAGQSLWEADLPKVSRELKNREWVEGVHIKRVWPSTVQITVRPHEVKLLYVNKEMLRPVIRDGRFLQKVKLTDMPDVPVLEGKEFSDVEMRKKAVAVLESLPSTGSFSRNRISEIRHSNKEGFWVTLINTGTKVKLGEDHLSLKAQRVSQVVDYLNTHQFDARVIDANLSKKVLVRLRNQP